MGFLDRLLVSPATRRLHAAEREAERWAPAPAPVKPGTAITVRAKAGGIGPPQGPPRNPPVDYMRDQPPPPPTVFPFRPGYDDHNYQNFAAPLGFEGFGLERIRTAVAAHRLGNFFESSALAVTILGFAPVLAALQQRVAPILGLSRTVIGGEKGLARLVAAEVEAALVARGGLLPSPYLPPALWGSVAASLALFNFAVLQHVDGDPDPDTGVRPRFTRTWPVWALMATRSPRKLLAMTTEGTIEVLNDGKFTLVADEEEPWLSSPICALGEETFGGKLSAENRYSFLDFFGKPKLWATPPAGLATHGPDGGDAFTSSVIDILYGPDGRAALPSGSKVEAVSISGEGAKAFQDAQLDAIIRIFMVLTGSAGTVGSGSATGAGPYQAAKGGAWAVRSDLYTRDTLKIVRALNQGHIAPYCDQNYAEGIARAKKAGAWRYPVLAIPIPAPDRDERIASEVTRYKALADQVMLETKAGAPPDQERVKTLAEAFEVRPFELAPVPPPPPPGAPPAPAAAPEDGDAGPVPPTAAAHARFVHLADRYVRARIEGGATLAELQSENAAVEALLP